MAGKASRFFPLYSLTGKGRDGRGVLRWGVWARAFEDLSKISKKGKYCVINLVICAYLKNVVFWEFFRFFLKMGFVVIFLLDTILKHWGEGRK